MSAPRGVIVTGGTGALGRAVVKQLLERGARVAVPYRDPAEWRGLLASAGEGRVADATATYQTRDDATLGSAGYSARDWRTISWNPPASPRAAGYAIACLLRSSTIPKSRLGIFQRSTAI